MVVKTALIAFVLAVNCLNVLALSTQKNERSDKFCIDEFQWGCTKSSDCCNAEHKCYILDGPSDLNGLLGRCQIPKENRVEAKICVEDHQLGCHSVSGSECCNTDRLCINGRCKPVPTILDEEEKLCVDEFQWGCMQNSDCCDETHECNTLGPQSDMNGLLGRCEPKAKKVEFDICIEDHQLGCHSVSGSECCNTDRLCINGRCKPVPTILDKEEKLCVDEFQWGCMQNSDCCDETHECNTFGPPSDMNGLLGRCEPKAKKTESDICIEDHQLGCHSVSGSECCNTDRLCINGRCKPVPTILDEEENLCVDEFQWGCTQNTDCCDEMHVCNTFGSSSDMNGLLGRCEPKEKKVESNTCVKDHQLGCHSIFGSECCNEDRLCINGRCKPVPTIMDKEETFCVDEYQWGCTKNLDCCNSEHKCYTFGHPSDMNGLMGRCQPPADVLESTATCVRHWGCKKSSDCCNKAHKCYVSNGSSDMNGLGGMCDF